MHLPIHPLERLARVAAQARRAHPSFLLGDNGARCLVCKEAISASGHTALIAATSSHRCADQGGK
jgi:hypothetical protein